MQAKRDREAAEAEDGWTVVVAKTGRKKTTDETGLSVGAVALEAAEDRGNKKRKKKADAALDFYRFQRHEARRNGEDCVLVSSFILSVPFGFTAQTIATFTLVTKFGDMHFELRTVVCHVSCSNKPFLIRVRCHAEVLELQERFQEDKKRIAALKAARKFRPF
jgi:hypothetical protein